MRARRLLVLLAALSPTLQAFAQTGYVLNLEGRWYLDRDPRQPLFRGQELPPGGVIRADSPSPSDFIIIADANGKIIRRRACNIEGECGRPVWLPKSRAQRASAWSVLFKTAMIYLSGDSEKYSVHMVRGEALRDGVVPLSGGGLDLRPVFKDMGGGDYLLTLRPVARGKGQGASAGEEPLKPLTFKWDPAGAGRLRAEGLAPGLYELSLVERRGAEYRPTLVDAWVLVTAPAGFEKARASFAEAQALARTWRPHLDDAARRSVLRAYLDSLAAAD